MDTTDEEMMKIKRAKANKTVGIIFAIMGIVFASIGGIIMYSQNAKLERVSASIEADTIEIGRYEDSDGDTMYRPTYYYTIKGKKYACESNSSSSSKPTGLQTTVKYNPENPSDCLTKFEERSTSIIYYIFIGLGVFFAVFGLGLAIFTKKPEVANTGNPNEPTPIR